MKSKFYSIIFGLAVALSLLSCNYDGVDLVGDWTKATAYGGNARGFSVYFTINDTVFVVGGKGYPNSTTTYYDEICSYCPATGSWKSASKYDPFPGGGRYGGLGFSIGNKGYFGCGRDKTTLYNDFYEFDPTKPSSDSAQWTKVASFPGNPIRDAICFTIGNYGYVFGGYTEEENATNWVYRYDAESNTWDQLEGLGVTTRLYGSAFVIDNKAYFVGGNNDNDYVEEFDCFDPEANTYTVLGYLDEDQDRNGLKGYDVEDVARNYGTAFTMNNKGYFLMGHKSSFCYDVWEYDPLTDDWNERTEFEGTQGRDYPIGFSYDGYGYMGLGYVSSTSYCKDLWKFNPNSVYSDYTY